LPFSFKHTPNALSYSNCIDQFQQLPLQPPPTPSSNSWVLLIQFSTFLHFAFLCFKHIPNALSYSNYIDQFQQHPLQPPPLRAIAGYYCFNLAPFLYFAFLCFKHTPNSQSYSYCIDQYIAAVPIATPPLRAIAGHLFITSLHRTMGHMRPLVSPAGVILCHLWISSQIRCMFGNSQVFHHHQFI